MERVTYRLNRGFDDIVANYINHGFTFNLGLGKYSCFIEFEDLKEKYIMKEQTKRTFIGYAKILHDMKREEVLDILLDIEDHTQEANNAYFDSTMYKNIEMPEVFGVDLNSAYLQTLLNLGIIRKKTFHWINDRLTKVERLVAVGLLAKQKTVLRYEKGKEIKELEKKETSPHRYLFNCVVQEVNDVMQEVKEEYKDQFLFYWVDGAYFTNEWTALGVQQMFEKRGYPAKIEHLTDFRVRDRFGIMEVTFKKDGKGKMFNLPVDEIYTDIQRNLFDTLRSLKIKQRLEAMDIDPESHIFKQGEIF